MGRYSRGDVILAPVPFAEQRGAKTRPAVVLAIRENGDLLICPVSSRPAGDIACIPIGLDDFTTGGLDLFSESYVLTAKAGTLPARDVIALKGRLAPDAIEAIGAQVRLPRDPSAPGTPGRRSPPRR
ncbi:type II toxin-antitoxin system PemK/MazF family toxin [Methanoregula sp.]|uniref:type II toxin-antitoxin system PemK/MazF family toxin n=1 Tax=Methanoregula sp. TaxID=2052170 RepID=UPI002CC356E4|nr:type II toxin-antitoxin system PemK/MazF family toxin [Methanoregula sp.]HVP96299.1 type II toxin-antitoxin system PemK/MazF family toxin [Methanoregula sp.]